jgi:hypothetical protein
LTKIDDKNLAADKKTITDEGGPNYHKWTISDDEDSDDY